MDIKIYAKNCYGGSCYESMYRRNVYLFEEKHYKFQLIRS